MQVLLQAKYITYEEINRRWKNTDFSDGNDFPKRTFVQCKKGVEEMFEVNIDCDPAQGYAYYIANLDDFRKNKSLQWLLNSFCTKELLSESEKVKDRIVYEEIPEKAEYLSLALDALKNNLLLKITYQPYSESETTDYVVHPYCMRLYKQHWYVLGYSETHKDLRHFAINRMVDLEIKSETFVYPDDFSPENYYGNSVGIYVDKKLLAKQVKLRVYGNEVNYFRSLPLHNSQREVFTEKEYSDFVYTLCETPDLIAEILRKGSKVEVLEPQSLKEKIADELNRMLNFYNRKNDK